MKFTIKYYTVAALAALALWVGSTQSGFGFTTNVFVGFGGALRFSPTNTFISTGDTVIWTWQSSGIPHTTTSGTNGVHADDNGVPSGLWDSGTISTLGSTFTNTFTSSGIFSYYCTIHHGVGMTGQVFVASANLPPTLAITNPLNAAVFAAPANVTIHAGVTNGSSTVTNVEFLANAAVIANVTAAPFSATANSLAAGGYTLTAIAEDNNGLLATNSIGISVVTPVTVSMTGVLRSLGTNFQFNYSANTGLDYVVQRSTNLMIWVSLETNTAASNPIVFIDIHATNSPNFYRVGRLPNP